MSDLKFKLRCSLEAEAQGLGRRIRAALADGRVFLEDIGTFEKRLDPVRATVHGEPGDEPIAFLIGRAPFADVVIAHRDEMDPATATRLLEAIEAAHAARGAR